MTDRKPTKTKKSKSLLIMFLIFAAFVIFVFLSQEKESIAWQDYDAGIALAKQQNKPALLTFIKQDARYYNLMKQKTYSNPDVKKFVEENFVPILIDVEKRPDLAEKYNIDYYPTHYGLDPETSKITSKRVGEDPPQLFISELKKFLEELKN